MASDADEAPDLASLLERHRDGLVVWLRRRGGGLLRYESAEDLAQGVHLKAHEVREHFAWRGDAAFVGWIRTLAAQHVADRNAWWKALKRNAGPMLRITYAGPATGEAGGVQPAGERTGPVTFTDRKLRLEVAVQALAALPERDRELVRMLSEGVDLDAVAERLGVTYAAAQRARLRATQRFRQAYEVLLRARTG